jgi:hypothetical protein
MSNNNNGYKKQSKVVPNVAIIHHRNSPNSAVTADKKEVRREDKIWYAEYDDEGYPITGRFIMCAPYDNHFVYEDPMWKIIPGRWAHMCTCGSTAVIVGYNAYKKDASPSTEGTTKGEMFVCYYHAQFGKHADGST